jgi:hypothetical protein
MIKKKTSFWNLSDFIKGRNERISQKNIKQVITRKGMNLFAPSKRKSNLNKTEKEIK